jgi:phage terminase large subunit-like protein
MACVEEYGPEKTCQAIRPDELEPLLHDWEIWARDDQLPPLCAADGRSWTSWLILGGRGSGKTRAGAEWTRGVALGKTLFSDRALSPIALVGETLHDVRSIMIDGPSGLLSIHPPAERPSFSASRRELEWPNGAKALMFSAEDPESLRGPQFAAAWCDELGKWRQAEKTWEMLQFCLRLGDAPRQAITTTPRPTKLLKALIADPLTAVSRAATSANAGNLAPVFLSQVVGRYQGTALGRQELDGELIEEREGALWRARAFDEARVPAAPPLARIVVAVDPSVTCGKSSDRCGIVAAGRCTSGRGYVLEDSTCRAGPLEWARIVSMLYHRWQADCVVAEVNQGGDLVESVLRQIEPNLPIRKVRAMRGKALRAEPVAALYAQGRISHVGPLPELEAEMCEFGASSPGGLSPDRLDALVWALSDLFLSGGLEPRIRSII